MCNKSERQIKMTFCKEVRFGGGGTKNYGKSVQKSTNKDDGFKFFHATNVTNNRDGFITPRNILRKNFILIGSDIR